MTALETLIDAGSVHIEDDAYIGTASDEVDVVLGNVGNESTVLLYLAQFPAPSDW